MSFTELELSPKYNLPIGEISDFVESTTNPFLQVHIKHL